MEGTQYNKKKEHMENMGDLRRSKAELTRKDEAPGSLYSPPGREDTEQGAFKWEMLRVLSP